MSDNNNSPLKEQVRSSNSKIYIHKKFKRPSALDESVNETKRQCSPSVPSGSGISDDQNFPNIVNDDVTTEEVSSAFERSFQSVHCPSCSLLNGIPAANITETFFCFHCAFPFKINFPENINDSTSIIKKQEGNGHDSVYSDISDPESNEGNDSLPNFYPIPHTTTIPLIASLTFKRYTNNASNLSEKSDVNSSHSHQYSYDVPMKNVIDRVSIQDTEQTQEISQYINPVGNLEITVQPLEKAHDSSCEANRHFSEFHQDSQYVNDIPFSATEAAHCTNVSSHLYRALCSTSTNSLETVDDNIYSTRKYKYDDVRLSEVQQMTSASIATLGTTNDHMEYPQGSTLGQSSTNKLQCPIQSTNCIANSRILTYDTLVDSRNICYDTNLCDPLASSSCKSKKDSRASNLGSQTAMKFLQCPTCYALFTSAHKLRRHNCVQKKLPFVSNFQIVTQENSTYYPAGNTVLSNHMAEKHFSFYNSSNNIVNNFSGKHFVNPCAMETADFSLSSRNKYLFQQNNYFYPSSFHQDINVNEYIQNGKVGEISKESFIKNQRHFQRMLPLRRAKSSSYVFHKPSTNNNYEIINYTRPKSHTGHFGMTSQIKPDSSTVRLDISSSSGRSAHFKRANQVWSNTNNMPFEMMNHQTQHNSNNACFDMTNQVSTSLHLSTRYQTHNNVADQINNSKLLHNSPNETCLSRRVDFQRNIFPVNLNKVQNTAVEFSNESIDSSVIESSQISRNISTEVTREDSMFNYHPNAATPHTVNIKVTEPFKSRLEKVSFVPARRVRQKGLFIPGHYPSYNNVTVSTNVQAAEQLSKVTPEPSHLSFKNKYVLHADLSATSTASATFSDLPTDNTHIMNDPVSEKFTSTCLSFPLLFQNVVHSKENNETTFVSQAVNSQHCAIPSFTNSTVPFKQTVVCNASKNHPDSSSSTKQSTSLYSSVAHVSTSLLTKFGMLNYGSSGSVNKDSLSYTFQDNRDIEYQATSSSVTPNSNNETDRVGLQSIFDYVAASVISTTTYQNYKHLFDNSQKSYVKQPKSQQKRLLQDKMSDGYESLEMDVHDGENVVLDEHKNRKCDVNGNYDIDMTVSQNMTPEYSLITGSTPSTTTSLITGSTSSTALLNMENELRSGVSQESLTETPIINTYMLCVYKCVYVSVGNFDTPVTYCTLRKLQPTYAVIAPEISKLSMYCIYELREPHNLLCMNTSKILSLYDSRNRQSSYSIAKLADNLCLTSSCCQKMCTRTGCDLRSRNSEVSDLSEIKSSCKNSGDYSSVCSKNVCSSDKGNALVSAAEENEVAYSLLSLYESFTPTVSVNLDHASSNSDTSQNVFNVGSERKRKTKAKTTVSKKGKVISQLGNSLVHHLSLDRNESTSFSTRSSCQMEPMTCIAATTVPVCETESLKDTAATHQQYTGISVAETSHNNKCIQNSFETSVNLPVDKDVTIQKVNLEVSDSEKISNMICIINKMISQTPTVKRSARTKTPNPGVSKNSEIHYDKVQVKANMRSVTNVGKSVADVCNVDVVLEHNKETENSLINSGSDPVLCPNVMVGDNLLPQNLGAIKKMRIKLMDGETYKLHPCDENLTHVDIPNLAPTPNKETASNSKEKGLKCSSEDFFKSMKNGPVCCKICKKKYTKPNQLYLHEQVHKLSLPYACELCHTSFTKKSALNKHYGSAVHCDKIKEFLPSTCEDCNLKFRCKGHFKKHLRSKKHIFKLEWNSKLACGTYAAMETKGYIPNDINTENCTTALISLRRISEKYIAEGLLAPESRIPLSGAFDLTLDEISRGSSFDDI